MSNTFFIRSSTKSKGKIHHEKLRLDRGASHIKQCERVPARTPRNAVLPVARAEGHDIVLQGRDRAERERGRTSPLFAAVYVG